MFSVLLTGFTVDYALDDPEPCAFGVVPGQVQLCHLILCICCDHPANCEMCCWNNQGICACRQCKRLGAVIREKWDDSTQAFVKTTKYYYNNFKSLAPGDYPQNTMADVREAHRLLLRAIASGVKKEVKEAAKSTGITWISIFSQLADLYGFDLVFDVLFDTMHTLLLNMIKNLLRKSMELGGEYFNFCLYKEHLNRFLWTPEHRSGRVPTHDISLDVLPYWKGLVVV